MADLGVPEMIPLSVAALLAGSKDRGTFRARYVEPGLLDIWIEGNRRFVGAASLETILGREISASEYLLALQAETPARRYQQHRRAEGRRLQETHDGAGIDR